MSGSVSIFKKQESVFNIYMIPQSMYPFNLAFTLFLVAIYGVGISHELFNEITGVFSYLTPRWVLLTLILYVFIWIDLWGCLLYKESFILNTFAIQRNNYLGFF